MALDGTGRNSPFAAALTKHLQTPGEDLSAILIKVRNDVMEAAANRQVPWEHSALRARFYFSPPEFKAAPPVETVGEFKVMEHRLLTAIMTPAMAIVWLTGLTFDFTLE